jgi:hypothetical protein
LPEAAGDCLQEASMMSEVVFDSDDFCMYPGKNCLEQLLYLKDRFPNFKATLFAIPRYKNYYQVDFFKMVTDEWGNWLELALHGNTHETNFECQKWSKDDAIAYLNRYRNSRLFVRGFKAPGWQISRGTYQALLECNYWVMDHEVSIYTEPVPNKERRPRNLKVFELDDPRVIHTHTWDTQDNGIKEMIAKWEVEGYPFNEDTKFKFISEVV